MYKGKKLRLGLGFKFGFFVGLLLITILSGISVFIYNQQREAIAREVTQRGAAIAENLANNASEALTANEELTLFVLAKQAVQEPLGQNDEDKNLAEKIIAILRDDLIQKKQRRLIKNDGILEAVIVRKKDGKIVSASDVAK
ncbi:MAG TPA: hypothetical protein P5511_00505, partial [Candidatus Goldiibacteriota bacterium]|nr:hypothetical protein [Candidatus Goldiibacteriota bacterium]